MNLNKYQELSRKTAIYPELGNNVIYPVLGLCGETGEIANKAKKIIRDDNGILTESIKKDLIDELGDALWYIANTASELGIDLNAIACINLDKLRDRENRGVISGSGDKR